MPVIPQLVPHIYVSTYHTQSVEIWCSNYTQSIPIRYHRYYPLFICIVVLFAQKVWHLCYCSCREGKGTIAGSSHHSKPLLDCYIKPDNLQLVMSTEGSVPEEASEPASIKDSATDDENGHNRADSNGSGLSERIESYGEKGEMVESSEELAEFTELAEDEPEQAHVEYILVAEFEVDQGPLMEHQYPNAISGDEQ